MSWSTYSVPPLLGMHNVVNGLPALKHDMGSIYAKPTQENNKTGHQGDSDNYGNEIGGYEDNGYGAAEKYSEGKTHEYAPYPLH